MVTAMMVLMATTMSMVAAHTVNLILNATLPPPRRTMHTAMATRNTARPLVATAMVQVIWNTVLGMATIRRIPVQVMHMKTMVTAMVRKQRQGIRLRATHMKTMVTGIVWKKQFDRIWSPGAAMIMAMTTTTITVKVVVLQWKRQ